MSGFRRSDHARDAHASLVWAAERRSNDTADEFLNGLYVFRGRADQDFV